MVELRQLTEINLKGNKISHIPQQIGIFRDLAILNLTNNELRGIPDQLFTLPLLTKLHLAGNGISYATNWPRLVDMFSRRELPLTTLDLSNNSISNWPEQISRNLCNLRDLWLGENE